MNASDLAFWLREEHVELAQSVAKLHEKTATLPRINEQRWLDELRKEFDHFRDHMNNHQALEERDGYMVQVVEQQPALSHEVMRMAHEHFEISKLMDGIRDHLEDLTPHDRLMIRDCCQRIHSLLQYIEYHEKNEDLLVTSLFGRDLGTAD
ncbi:MAG: hemerythrin domain-containing protein [Planctomycetes bacterium]|nr:hemerythrin domain-containing protein [Planctomycetota bacterium]